MLAHSKTFSATYYLPKFIQMLLSGIQNSLRYVSHIIFPAYLPEFSLCNPSPNNIKLSLNEEIFYVHNLYSILLGKWHSAYPSFSHIQIISIIQSLLKILFPPLCLSNVTMTSLTPQLWTNSIVMWTVLKGNLPWIYNLYHLVTFCNKYIINVFYFQLELRIAQNIFICYHLTTLSIGSQIFIEWITQLTEIPC